MQKKAVEGMSRRKSGSELRRRAEENRSGTHCILRR
jgi:hypothetical protein